MKNAIFVKLKTNYMKRILSFLISILCSVAAFSQTAEEIVQRMDKVLEQHQDGGLYMIVDIKVPVVGTISTKTWTYGEKIRMEAKLMGVEVVTFMDDKTQWTYNSKNNEVVIENSKDIDSGSEGDIEMFSGITDGYDVSIKGETDKAWRIQCKKSKANKSKDDPKNMDLVVEKGTYNPMSLSTKLNGMTLTMRNLSFNVTEKQATFNIKDYPDATIVDKR